MVSAICREAELENHYLGGERVETIYFGGGTPSLLSGEEIGRILLKLKTTFQVSPTAEITLEANPDDVDEPGLTAWKQAGINRLSMGLQSFFEEELRWMNRAHSAAQANEAVPLALRYFDNITVDLIYGSPLLSNEMWKQNVDRVIALRIPHLSCYALTVEEKTPLEKQISRKLTTDVDPDRQATQFLLLMDWLRDAGYEHYEVSNFAKPGFRSRHNSAYWQGRKYLGLGPSAHSYNGVERRWNPSNNQQYIRGIEEDRLLRESEILTDSQRFNEYVMIGLRTTEGIDLSEIEKRWNSETARAISDEMKLNEAAGLVQRNGSNLHLTDQGMLRADGIAASIFRTE